MGRRRKKQTLILILDFVLTLNLLSLPLYFIIFFNIQLQFFKELVALLSSGLLNLIGLKAIAIDNFIIVNNYFYEVSWDSTGWKSMYTFFSLVLSLPVFFKRKIKFLIFGLISIFLFNLLRIVSTIYLSSQKIVSFDFLHMFLWREASILFVLILWFIFLYIQKNNIGETKILLGVFGARRKPKVKTFRP
ncbi:MAG: archaeosortase/exosortase family protein [Candidatus Aenigmatarchaeota archaeon]